MGRVSTILLRTFKCSGCGRNVTATKKSSWVTGNGHYKGIYCPFCRRKMRMTQIEYERIKVV